MEALSDFLNFSEDIIDETQIYIKDFLPNEVVWGKLSNSIGFWPGIVINPSEWGESFFKSTDEENKIWIFWIGARCNEMFSKVLVVNVCEFYSNFNRFYDANHSKKSYHKGINLALMIFNETFGKEFGLVFDIEKLKFHDFSNFEAVAVTEGYHWKRIIPNAIYKQISLKSSQCRKMNENLRSKKRSCSLKRRTNESRKIAETLPNFECTGINSRSVSSTVVIHDNLSVEFFEFDVN